MRVFYCESVLLRQVVTSDVVVLSHIGWYTRLELGGGAECGVRG